MNRYVKPVLTNLGNLIIKGYFSFPRLAKHKDKYPIEYRYSYLRKTTMRLNRGLDMDIEIRGKENIPDELGCLITPNHCSWTDPVVVFEAIEKPCSVVSKVEIKKIQVFKSGVEMIDGLFMDRDDLRQSLKVMQEVEESLKKKDKNWIIFPEGTRTRDAQEKVLDYHYGTFKPAIRAKSIIVPVAICGTSKVLKLKPRYKKYPIIISILKPIYPNEYEGMSTKELASYVQSLIQKEITFNLRKDVHQKMLKYKNYRFNNIN